MRARSPPRKPGGAVRSASAAIGHGVQRQSLLDPIITMNAGGIIQSASDSVEQVFGWTPTELFGRNVKMLIPEPRRSALDRYLDRYRHADKTKTLNRTGRFDAVRKDGKVIQIEMSMSRADLPAFAAPFFVGIIRDVSREIVAGAGTPEERTRLQRLITEQTRALATANLRLYLSDRLASLGTLAAGLGHDMNNVLLPVSARLNAIEHAGLSPSARTHLTSIRRSIAYLQHLSHGLHFLALDPDAPGGGGAEVTDLARWWRHVGPLLRTALPKHVKLQASFPARIPAVKIAPHSLTQAALNLIVNAGEAMPEGRRGARVRVRASLDDAGRNVRLAFTDNGRGMALGVQRRAFDLFFTTKARGIGTGLGLPLARKVAVGAGGDLELRSVPGRETVATLVLPVGALSTNANGSRSAPASLTAALSVRDHRVAALISQVLVGAGVTIRPGGKRGPGRADLWVTEPTAFALRAALQSRRRRASLVVALVGTPSKAMARKWAAFDTLVIDPPDDFEAIRHIVRQAIDACGKASEAKS